MYIISTSFRTFVSKGSLDISAKCSKTDKQQKKPNPKLREDSFSALDSPKLFIFLCFIFICWRVYIFRKTENGITQLFWQNILTPAGDINYQPLLFKKNPFCFMIEKPKAEVQEREMTKIFICNSGYVRSYTISYALAIQAI